MDSVISYTDVFKFIIGKLMGLTVTSWHYLNLLGKIDKMYPIYIQHIKEALGYAIKINQ